MATDLANAMQRRMPELAREIGRIVEHEDGLRLSFDAAEKIVHFMVAQIEAATDSGRQVLSTHGDAQKRDE